MCALSGVPGTRGFEVEGREEVSEEERATRVTSKEYFCQKHGLALVALEHFEQLDALAAAEAHEVFGRSDPATRVARWREDGQRAHDLQEVLGAVLGANADDE